MTLNLTHTTLSVGATAPFTAIHASDTHLTYADMRDGQRKVDLISWRLPGFPHAETVLTELGELSRKLNAPILHTGDLIDYVSLANLEAAKAFTDTHDIFMATGNHEFSLYVGEAKEDAAYRNQSLPAVQACFKNNIRMDARIIGDVNFIALDNGYYTFEPEQFAFLKAEAEKGLPMVLMMHTPLYDPALYEIMMGRCPCAYLAGVPEELMRCYPEDRYIQQMADEATLEMMEYIANEPLVKAILAGHIHANCETVYAGRIPQLTVGCVDARVIEFS